MASPMAFEYSGFAQSVIRHCTDDELGDERAPDPIEVRSDEGAKLRPNKARSCPSSALQISAYLFFRLKRRGRRWIADKSVLSADSSRSSATIRSPGIRQVPLR